MINSGIPTKQPAIYHTAKMVVGFTSIFQFPSISLWIDYSTFAMLALLGIAQYWIIHLLFITYFIGEIAGT